MSRFKPNLLAFPDTKNLRTRVNRILRAGLICDIVQDALTIPPIFHWIVQDCETDEILGLGQSHTFSEAEMTATWFLDDLRLRRAI